MRKKSVRIHSQFDETEFLLLAFVVVAFLVFVGWQTNILPRFVTQAVLGISAIP